MELTDLIDNYNCSYGQPEKCESIKELLNYIKTPSDAVDILDKIGDSTVEHKFLSKLRELDGDVFNTQLCKMSENIDRIFSSAVSDQAEDICRAIFQYAITYWLPINEYILKIYLAHCF